MSATQTLDAAALANLTDDEREAIESGDMTAEELAAMQRIAAGAGADGATDGDDDDDISDHDDDGDDDGQGAAPVERAAAAPAAPAADAGTTAPASAPATAAAPAVAPAPRYEAALPADFDARVQDLATRESELKRAFRAGEIEFDDFEAKRDELLREREGLTIARTKAEIASEMTAQTAEQQWRSTVDSFLNAQAKVMDYRANAEAMGDLDAFVKMLAAKDANAHQPMEWFLAEAHKRVMALHGGNAAPAPAPAPAAASSPAEAKVRASAARKPDPTAAPATLAQVPGADGPGDVGGEFGDVLSLDGMEYESAIARMTPAQRERFARAT